MTIRLTTLGGLHARADDGELDWLLSQRLRAALFVYLAVERQVSREALLAAIARNSEALQWFESLGSGSVSEIALKGLSHLRQAEIHERLGNRTEAPLIIRSSWRCGATLMASSGRGWIRRGGGWQSSATCGDLMRSSPLSWVCA